MQNYRNDNLAAQMEKEFREFVARSDEATARTIADNLNTTAMFQAERKKKALGAGLKACIESGLGREACHRLIDAAFDEANREQD